MSIEQKTNAAGVVPATSSRSEMDPVIIRPGSKADPSVAPDWQDHVQEYFNQDAIEGEAIPMATHEAKEAPPAGDGVE